MKHWQRFGRLSEMIRGSGKALLRDDGHRQSTGQGHRNRMAKAGRWRPSS
jgi:hypothetical protein